jgi:outer membrane protein
MPLVSPKPESEEAWVKAALDQNLDLTSARLAADISRDNIAIARTGHYPSVDLVASKSFSSTDATATIFDPTSSISANTLNHDNQIGIQLTVPLYAGGATSSRVREATYRHRAALERLERTARATERTARDAYRGVLSEISQVQALKQALASSATALQATEAGYDVGTRTAVDVLLARQRLLDAQSNYAIARYDYVINVLTLEQAAGTLDESRVTRVNAWLNQTVSVR